MSEEGTAKKGTVAAKGARRGRPSRRDTKRALSAEEKLIRTATLRGQGWTYEEIAPKVGLAPGSMDRVSRQIRNSAELRALVEESRHRHIPEVLEASGLAVKAMVRGLNDPECPVNHAAAAYRELRGAVTDALAGVDAPAGPTASASGISPQAVAELLMALQNHEQSNAETERQVEGERVE